MGLACASGAALQCLVLVAGISKHNVAQMTAAELEACSKKDE